MALTYLKKYHCEDEWTEVTPEVAHETLLTWWKDSDATRDMLTIPNYIECRYADIMVKDGSLMAMPGLKNLTPPDAEYDDVTWSRIN